jgi:hypothetical protein
MIPLAPHRPPESLAPGGAGREDRGAPRTASIGFTAGRHLSSGTPSGVSPLALASFSCCGSCSTSSPSLSACAEAGGVVVVLACVVMDAVAVADDWTGATLVDAGRARVAVPAGPAAPPHAEIASASPPAR